jgi:hypothetical protein
MKLSDLAFAIAPLALVMVAAGLFVLALYAYNRDRPNDVTSAALEKGVRVTGVKWAPTTGCYSDKPMRVEVRNDSRHKARGDLELKFTEAGFASPYWSRSDYVMIPARSTEAFCFVAKLPRENDTVTAAVRGFGWESVEFSTTGKSAMLPPLDLDNYKEQSPAE